MKNIPAMIVASLTLLASAAALAAKPIPGPQGGRILTSEPPHAEFIVGKDRRINVAFYDARMQPIAVGTRLVSAVAEAKGGRVTLAFEPSGSGLASRSALPDGDHYTVVVQIRDAAGAKPKNYRVFFNEDICRECKRPEYACTCDDSAAAGHRH